MNCSFGEEGLFYLTKLKEEKKIIQFQLIIRPNQKSYAIIHSQSN